MKLWRYELAKCDAGGFRATRCLVESPEPTTWALRLELPAHTPRGYLMALVGELLCAVSRDTNYKAVTDD